MKTLLALFALLAAPSALACSVPAPVPFEVDTGLADEVPPAAPHVTEVSVTRGRGPQGGMSTSCDDIGFVAVTLALPDEPVGVEVELVSGEAPDLGGLLDGPQQLPIQDGAATLSLHWIDGATDDQEPLELTLGITAIDRAGNESPRIDVPVKHPGAPTIAPPARRPRCSSVGASGWLALGVLPLLVARRTAVSRTPPAA